MAVATARKLDCPVKGREFPERKPSAQKGTARRDRHEKPTDSWEQRKKRTKVRAT